MMPAHPFPKSQKGSVILAMMAMFMVIAGYLLVKEFNNAFIARDKISDDALVKAKEALIGFAATYRDTQPNPLTGFNDQVFGYLPCPATDGNGRVPTPSTIPPNCGTPNITRINILPWASLELPALRDSAGECLRYAVSGTYKNNQMTAVMNWDTAGLINIVDADGNVLANGAAAVVFAPRGRIPGQNRTPAGNTECRTNNVTANYLEGANISGAALANSTATRSTPASLQAGTNNDKLIWVTPAEIFNRVKQRTDFKTDIDSMMTGIVNCLNTLPPSSLPAAVPGTNKGLGAFRSQTPWIPFSVTGNVADDIVSLNCLPATPLPQLFNVWANWFDNVLYARLGASGTMPTPITVNGASCYAVLIFGGERTGTQARATAAQKNLSTNYLEGTNLASFPNGTTYSGSTGYDKSQSSADIVRCITSNTPPGGGGTQVTFAANFSNFVAAGTGVTANSGTQSVAVANSTGASGGCFWYPTALPLNGRTVRAYYDFTFGYADTRAVTGTGTDHGNGFNFSLLRGDQGAPSGCGAQNDMGMFNASTSFGLINLFVETDVREDNADNDPQENHTAIMTNGNFNHPAGTVTTACNGTQRGCRHSPANKFEESPTPLNHNQRMEIHTGYTDAACTGGTGGNYAQIKVWVDCAGCNDTSVDFASTATVARCITLDPAMNNFYFGFTGGFRTGGAIQSVTIRNLDLRTQ